MLNSLLVKSIIKKDIESGEISGTTEKATKDSEGNVITETYATKKESESSDKLLSTAIKEEETRSNEYTDQKIADLINGAPATLDTLKEIADAMDDKLESEVATDFSEAETPKFQQTIDDVLDGVNELKGDLSELRKGLKSQKKILNAYIGGDGKIGSWDNNKLYAYEIDGLDYIDSIRASTTNCYYSFYVDEPNIGSVSYNNNRVQLLETHYNVKVPSGCNWIVIYVGTLNDTVSISPNITSIGSIEHQIVRNNKQSIFCTTYRIFFIDTSFREHTSSVFSNSISLSSVIKDSIN